MNATKFPTELAIIATAVCLCLNLSPAPVHGRESLSGKQSEPIQHSVPHWLGGEIFHSNRGNPSQNDANNVDSVGSGTRRLQKNFVTNTAIQTAEIRFASDYCGATIFINGNAVARVEPYCQVQNVVVTDAIKNGENRIEIVPHAMSEAQSFVALSLVVQNVDG
ncbi:MAG: hypothetical protein FJ267_10315, partial [Planctomycetes bacterium]|nr:hypothetical protein [Planctomycetota bacterium]